MLTEKNVKQALIEAEKTLLDEHDAAGDPSRKAALAARVKRVQLDQAGANLADVAARAALLNRLAADLEGMAAELRSNPLKQLAMQVRRSLDGADGTPQPSPRPARPPRATPRAAPPPPPGRSPTPDPGVPGPPAGATTADIRDLAAMFASCKLSEGRLGEIDRAYVAPLVAERAAYEAVGATLKMPWWFVGVLHGMERNFSFQHHLHNGDPLTARTVKVPEGRPLVGNPPFTWPVSALDALEDLAGLTDWTLAKVLDRFERYNGTGYRKRGLPSPYLWSFSDHYTKGKFEADGKYNSELVSKQCGAAVLLKRLVEKGIVNFDAPSATAGPAPTGAAAGEPSWLAVAREEERRGIREDKRVGMSNRRIEEYFSYTTFGRHTDDFAWCAAFISFCLAQAGALGADRGSARAKDWLRWGQKLGAPEPGCVVVMKPDSSVQGTSGHVGFYVGKQGEKLKLLGGNQKDQVMTADFRESRVQPDGYRWPN